MGVCGSKDEPAPTHAFQRVESVEISVQTEPIDEMSAAAMVRSGSQQLSKGDENHPARFRVVAELDTEASPSLNATAGTSQPAQAAAPVAAAPAPLTPPHQPTSGGRAAGGAATEWRPDEWLVPYALTNTTEPAIDKFKVRNRYYLNAGHKLKGKKERSNNSCYKLSRAALIRSHERIDHVVSKFPLPPRPPGMPPSIVIVFQVNPAPHPRQHVVFLFDKEPAKDQTIPARDLEAYKRVEEPGLKPDSGLVAERLKVIPFIPEGGNWILQKAVNNVCGQLSAALEVVQHGGDGYIEVDVDVDAFKSNSIFTKIAKPIITMLQPQLKKLTVDIAFMMQGDCEDELPERIFAAIRVARIDMRVMGALARRPHLTTTAVAAVAAATMCAYRRRDSTTGEFRQATAEEALETPPRRRSGSRSGSFRKERSSQGLINK